MDLLGTLLVTLSFAAAPAAVAAQGGSPPSAAGGSAERFARLALACVHQEYPNKIAHVLQGDDDVAPPRELTPAFYGCYDWHSSVHGHWLLARLARTFPEAPFAAEARSALGQSLTAENLAGEVAYLSGAGRVSFERPYGLAWLLQLAAELREWDDPQAQEWSKNLEPLERLAAARIAEWVPKLANPIRIGEHDQTAFAFGLILDWAKAAGDGAMRDLLACADRRAVPGRPGVPAGLRAVGPGLPVAVPGGGGPAAAGAAAGAVRGVAGGLPAGASRWTARRGGCAPAVVTDPSDPKLAHLDGLNLSRAWMLEGMAAGLPADDPRVASLAATAAAHREAGLASVTGEHYEGGHWLGSFATYLVTRRGIRVAGRASPHPALASFRGSSGAGRGAPSAAGPQSQP